MMHLYIPQPDGTFVEHNFEFVEDYVTAESKAPIGSWTSNGYSIRKKLSHFQYSTLLWDKGAYVYAQPGTPELPEVLRAYLFLIYNISFE